MLPRLMCERQRVRLGFVRVLEGHESFDLRHIRAEPALERKGLCALRKILPDNGDMRYMLLTLVRKALPLWLIREAGATNVWYQQDERDGPNIDSTYRLSV